MRRIFWKRSAAGFGIICLSGALQAQVQYGDLLVSRVDDNGKALPGGIVKPADLSWVDSPVSEHVAQIGLSANLEKYAYCVRNTEQSALVLNISDLKKRDGSGPDDWQSPFGHIVSIDVGADGFVYAAREAGASAIRLDPDHLNFGGGPDNQTDHKTGCDISVGPEYGYLARRGDDGRYMEMLLLDKSNLDFVKGVTSHSSAGKKMGMIRSVDYGPDGFVYCAREGLSALQFSATTLEWTGLQTVLSNGKPVTDLVDVSKGPDGFLYGVTASGDIAKFDSTLKLIQISDIPGRATSVDVVTVPRTAGEVPVVRSDAVSPAVPVKDPVVKPSAAKAAPATITFPEFNPATAEAIWAPGIKPEAIPQPQYIADGYTVVAKALNDWKSEPWIGNPLITKTPSGRLLVLYSGSEPRVATLMKSDNGGETWEHLASLNVLPWPNLFVCQSGIYVIYPPTDALWHTPVKTCHGMEIIRSTDDGNTWSAPSEITATKGMAFHTGNTGVLVSKGRVTSSFEVAPASSVPKPATELALPVQFAVEDLDDKTTWVTVKDAGIVPRYTLVVITQGTQKLYCRVMDVDKTGGRFHLRPEHWTAVEKWKNSPSNSSGPWNFSAGASLEVASGTLGNNRDFWSIAMDAPDDPAVNLCDPSVWRVSNPVANPLYAFGKAMHDTFGMVFDYRDENGRPDDGGRWAGWLEGVCVRLEHEGGSGKILNLLRTSQGATDSLSGRVLFDDSGTELTAEFERIGFDEGLGVTHCYVEYDKPSGLYWMTSNVNRDSSRDISHMWIKGEMATQERANLALFFSRNARDWFMAGMVAYSRDWAHSYHYPHFVISGEDLLVIARSHIESPIKDSTMNKKSANNHDSNAVTFHKVKNFRSLANRDFIDYIVK